MAERSFTEVCDAVVRDPAGCVARAEEHYRSEIAKVCDTVLSRGCRVVLLAGPSASGKTTTANLIADALTARGKTASVISLDHFYRAHDDPDYPLLPSGERDMESVYALDLDLFRDVARRVCAGLSFTVPHYDFLVGKRTGAGTVYPASDGCVIFEGLHALNPEMSDSLPPENTLKIFISVSTNLNAEDGKRILSGKRMRFIRRLVRDSLYRGADAEQTLAVFASVVAGEDKYLYPYRDRADLTFDTFHEYELAVMKPFAEALLTEKVRRDPYACRVVEALKKAPTLPESVVPSNSLMREFIPGGIYEHLY